MAALRTPRQESLAIGYTAMSIRKPMQHTTVAVQQKSRGLDGAPNALAGRRAAASQARLSVRRGDAGHSDHH
jgi:hypothetical protein